MMRLLKLAVLMPLLLTPTLGAPAGSVLDALQKSSPSSSSHALQTAAKWLEDNYGAAAAEDLNGVSNFAVDAMSLVAADGSLSPHAKQVLRRAFLKEPETAQQKQSEETSLDALHKLFPDTRSDVLKTAAKWMHDNFGAATAEDLDGVSDWAIKGMSMAAADTNLTPDTKRVLQLFFQGQAAQKQRRLASSSSTTSSTSTAALITSTTTTTTTTSGTTTTTTTGPTTTTTTTTAVTSTTTSTAAPGNVTTSMKVTTTTGSEALSYSVTPRQLATSVAGLVLLKMLAGL